MPLTEMKTLPDAVVIHSMPGRVRIRITQAIGKHHLSQIEKKLGRVLDYQLIHGNPVTGSILLQDPNLDLDVLASEGLSRKLFRLEVHNEHSPALVTRHARSQVRRIDSGIRKLTDNRLNLSGSVFLILILHAMAEIIRGNLAVPSWFSALWFATTLYNREWMGFGSDKIPLHDNGDMDDQ